MDGDFVMSRNKTNYVYTSESAGEVNFHNTKVVRRNFKNFCAIALLLCFFLIADLAGQPTETVAVDYLIVTDMSVLL